MFARLILSFSLILSILSVREVSAQTPADSKLETLILELSEPSSYFDTDNLLSNESSYLQVVEQLREITKPGQAYLGVGPDQNFTYIVHARPALALLVDVRRDNLLLHLYFKELLETSADRWQYLSGLFGKPLPTDHHLEKTADAALLADYLSRVPSSHDFFEETFSKLWSSIHRRFPKLTKEEDQDTAYTIARRFYEEDLQLRYRSHGRRPRLHYPTYQQLMTSTYRGWIGHYLNSDSDYQFLKRMQAENRIIPVVGDLGGSKTLRGIGSYLKQRRLSVSAFYVSNVEFYLFRDGKFSDFQRNLSTLPISSNSLIVRSYFNYHRKHPETLPGYFVTSLVQKIGNFLKLNGERPYRDYWDVVTRDYLPTEKLSKKLEWVAPP